jgi:hypothetical protein
MLACWSVLWRDCLGRSFPAADSSHAPTRSIGLETREFVARATRARMQPRRASTRRRRGPDELPRPAVASLDRAFPAQWTPSLRVCNRSACSGRAHCPSGAALSRPRTPELAQARRSVERAKISCSRACRAGLLATTRASIAIWPTAAAPSASSSVARKSTHTTRGSRAVAWPMAAIPAIDH